MGLGAPPDRRERAVCAARRSSVVDGRSSLVGSPGATGS